MQNLLLGIADVKCFMTFGNINKPLKVLVHLDSLTCCPEVEPSLTEEALYGLSGGGGGETLSTSLSCLFHSVFFWEQRRRRTPHSGAPEVFLCPRERARESRLGFILLLCLFLIKKYLLYPQVGKIICFTYVENCFFVPQALGSEFHILFA